MASIIRRPPAASRPTCDILAQAQADLGADVSVLCVNHEAGPTIEERDGPVRVTRFRRVASVDKLDICPGLAAGLRRVEADILHIQAPNPTMILGLLAARPRQPVIVSYQSDVVRQWCLEALFRPLEWLAYRRVRVILSSSPTYAAGSRFLRRYRDRLHVLPDGIDLEPYSSPLPEDQAKAERIQGGTSRTAVAGRRPLGLLQGLPQRGACSAAGAGTLLLVGGGPEEPALRAEAARLGVLDRIVFLGAMPYQQIVPYYLAAKALWFPSNARSEAFGIVQVEAMATGCPVINTAIPHSGVPWVSRHEETGLTVPVDDPAAFAAAALRLLEEPGLRDRLAAGPRARAIAEFQCEAMGRWSLAAATPPRSRPHNTTGARRAEQDMRTKGR